MTVAREAKEEGRREKVNNGWLLYSVGEKAAGLRNFLVVGI